MVGATHVVRRAVDGTMAKGSFRTGTVTSRHRHLGPLGAARKDPALGPKEAVLAPKH